MTQSNSQPKKTRTNKEKERIAYFVMGGIAMLVGVILLFSDVRNVMLGKQSTNWPTTTGKVLSSDIEIITSTAQSRHGTDHVPEIKYTYEVNGQNYTSDRVTFRYVKEKGEANLLVYNHPVDESAEIYYNPDDPSMSVLQPGTTAANYKDMWMGGGCLLLGLVGIFWAAVRIRPQEQANEPLKEVVS